MEAAVNDLEDMDEYIERIYNEMRIKPMMPRWNALMELMDQHLSTPLPARWRRSARRRAEMFRQQEIDNIINGAS